MVNPDFPWPFREACLSRKPVFVFDLAPLLDGYERRGWEDDPIAGVVIPITKDEGVPRAVLIVGLNPRRPFDSAYANWLQFIARQLATHIAITEGYANEVAKAQELAQYVLFASTVSSLSLIIPGWTERRRCSLATLTTNFARLSP